MSAEEARKTAEKAEHSNACCDPEQFSEMFQKMSGCCAGQGDLPSCAGFLNYCGAWRLNDSGGRIPEKKSRHPAAGFAIR